MRSILAESTRFLGPVIDIARRAGAAILGLYDLGNIAVTHKTDASPLSEADLRAHRTIIQGLHALTPDWPVLSEESSRVEFCERALWPRYWLVDPLDGTKEFLSRNGEFTVNIALVEQGAPILGVLHAPARSVSYLGARGCGAFRAHEQGAWVSIRVQSTAQVPLRVLASRSHGDAKLDRALERLGQQQRVSIGSALKFGLLADGSADLYVRRGDTSEWDTAAGHAVVLEAGGCVVDLSGQPLRYNERDTLINPWFMAYADRSRDWIGELGQL
jgi:3'(2'), 5'-bisphosphate nucleotidase